MAHSNELRHTAINAYFSGEKISSISKVLKIPTDTIYGWIYKYNKTGNMDRGFTTKGAKPAISEPEFILYMSNPKNQEKTQLEMTKDFGVTIPTIAKMLKKHGFSKKKSFTYSEANEQKRAIYLDEIKQYDDENIVYIDESGMKKQPYEYGWSKVGEKIFAKKEGKKPREKINLIAGLLNGKLIALERFEENCNTEIFTNWLEFSLLPKLKKGMVIVMDNVSFHHNIKVRKIIESNGLILLHLPAYSPDLNPIENYWHCLKNSVRKELRNTEKSLLDSIDKVIKCF